MCAIRLRYIGKWYKGATEKEYIFRGETYIGVSVLSEVVSRALNTNPSLSSLQFAFSGRNVYGSGFRHYIRYGKAVLNDPSLHIWELEFPHNEPALKVGIQLIRHSEYDFYEKNILVHPHTGIVYPSNDNIGCKLTEETRFLIILYDGVFSFACESEGKWRFFESIAQTPKDYYIFPCFSIVNSTPIYTRYQLRVFHYISHIPKSLYDMCKLTVRKHGISTVRLPKSIRLEIGEVHTAEFHTDIFPSDISSEEDNSDWDFERDDNL